jgi:hypothetical protein
MKASAPPPVCAGNPRVCSHLMCPRGLFCVVPLLPCLKRQRQGLQACQGSPRPSLVRPCLTCTNIHHLPASVGVVPHPRWLQSVCPQLQGRGFSAWACGVGALCLHQDLAAAAAAACPL